MRNKYPAAERHMISGGSTLTLPVAGAGEIIVIDHVSLAVENGATPGFTQVRIVTNAGTVWQASAHLVATTGAAYLSQAFPTGFPCWASPNSDVNPSTSVTITSSSPAGSSGILSCTFHIERQSDRRLASMLDIN